MDLPSLQWKDPPSHPWGHLLKSQDLQAQQAQAIARLGSEGMSLMVMFMKVFVLRRGMVGLELETASRRREVTEEHRLWCVEWTTMVNWSGPTWLVIPILALVKCLTVLVIQSFSPGTSFLSEVVFGRRTKM